MLAKTLFAIATLLVVVNGSEECTSNMPLLVTDNWCDINCNNEPSFCPSAFCSCVGVVVETSCVSKIGFITDSWCETNCNNEPAFCPEAFCDCGDVPEEVTQWFADTVPECGAFTDQWCQDTCSVNSTFCTAEVDCCVVAVDSVLASRIADAIPGATTVTLADFQPADDVVVVPSTMMGVLVPGQQATVEIELDSTSGATVEAIIISFVTISGNKQAGFPTTGTRIPIDQTPANGVISVTFTVPPEICMNLGRICHDVRCYESAQTSIGTITAADLADLILACGTNPSSCFGIVSLSPTASLSTGASPSAAPTPSTTPLDCYGDFNFELQKQQGSDCDFCGCGYCGFDINNNTACICQPGWEGDSCTDPNGDIIIIES